MSTREEYQATIFQMYFEQAGVQDMLSSPTSYAHARTVVHMAWADQFYCYTHDIRRHWSDNAAAFICGRCTTEE